MSVSPQLKKTEEKGRNRKLLNFEGEPDITTP